MLQQGVLSGTTEMMAEFAARTGAYGDRQADSLRRSVQNTEGLATAFQSPAGQLHQQQSVDFGQHFQRYSYDQVMAQSDGVSRITNGYEGVIEVTQQRVSASALA